MNKTLTRRGMLVALASGVAAPALANAPLTSLRPQSRPGSTPIPSAESMVRDAGLTGVTAFVVARADGTIIEAQGADMLLPPASVAKAATALYALDALGPGYRFATVVMADGPIEDGTLKGDLILKGTGDPILDTDALGGLAEQLALAGITAITGRFLVDTRGLPHVESIEPGQPVQVGYNPSISGLNLNYNRVHFEWRRNGGDYRLTMDARAKVYQPRVMSSKMRIVPEAWPVFAHRMTETSENWTVARPALGNGGSRWLPVRRSGAYAGDVFRTLAQGKGIKLPAAEPDTGPIRGAVLAVHSSPTLRGLCGGMLRYSTNLTAEVLGLRASQARGLAPQSLENSAAGMNDWLAANYATRMAFVDHSGLGDRSRVTCGGLVKMLNGAGEGYFAPRLKAFDVKDRHGTVIEDPPHSIKAKTGTLNFVNALAGYVTPKAGPPLTFAIISADLPRRAAIPKTDMERPQGARSFARRARLLQNALTTRWANMEQA